MEIQADAIRFLTLCASGKMREAYDKYVANDFIHHNPYFSGDAQSLMQGMEENASKNPNKIFEVQRSAQQNDLVFVHSKVRINEAHAGIAVVHIFRFQEDLIAELWDIAQPVPENMQNTHGMF